MTPSAHLSGHAEPEVADRTSAGRERAHALALRALARRDHTVAELRSRLAGRGHGAPDVEHVIAELERVGYLDDVRVAERFVHDRREAGWGSVRIEVRLRERGVEEQTVAAALSAAPGTSAGESGDDDEDERARAVLRRRGRPATTVDDGARRRAYALLARRGFSAEVAERAVADVLGRGD